MLQRCAIKTKTGIFVWLLLTLPQSVWAEGWKLEKQKQGVEVYSQSTESGYKKVLAKTTLKVHPHRLVALLNDVEYSSSWMHNCIKVEVIEEISPSERIINSFFAAPWPVKDRDMVIRSQTTITDNAVMIKITDSANHIEPHAKYVRMQDMHGIWRANLLENGLTEISYTGGGNPGGKLPTFIADRELISSMFNTFQNLHQALLLAKYQADEITD